MNIFKNRYFRNKKNSSLVKARVNYYNTEKNEIESWQIATAGDFRRGYITVDNAYIDRYFEEIKVIVYKSYLQK